MKAKVLICSLNRKGAGPKLALDLAKKLASREIQTTLFFIEQSDVFNEASKEDSIDREIISLPNYFSLISPWRFLKFHFALRRLISKMNPDRIIFVMPHPWDMYITEKVPVIRVIHDITRKKGEGFWPTKCSLKARIKSNDTLIALSEHVAQDIRKMNRQVIVADHPVLEFEKNQNITVQNSNQVLFIGRQMKYKGGKLLAEAWPLVISQHPEAKLVVAGEGKIESSLYGLDNVEFINHWLSESEISILLASSKVVVFPYSEASQSGMIFSAAASNAIVVGTPVGGIREQVKKVDGIIAAKSSPIEVANAISMGFSKTASTMRFMQNNENSLDLVVFRLLQPERRLNE